MIERMRKSKHSKKRCRDHRPVADFYNVHVHAVSIPSLVANARHAVINGPRCIVLKERSSLLQPQLPHRAILQFEKMSLPRTLPLTRYPASATILAKYLFTPHTRHCFKRNSRSTSQGMSMSKKRIRWPSR